MQRYIADFCVKLRHREDLHQLSEAEIKQSIILYILKLLDWDIFNIEEVNPEYDVGGLIIDYVLHLYGKPVVIIKVVGCGEDPESHEPVIFESAKRIPVKIMIITDGFRWHFYFSGEEQELQYSYFAAIDIIRHDPPEAAVMLSKYLSKAKISSGEAIRMAESTVNFLNKDKVITDSLQRAWNKLITDKDNVLVTRLKSAAEMICGFDINRERVIEFFSQELKGIRFEVELKSAHQKPEIPANRGKPNLLILSSERKKKGRNTTLEVYVDWSKLGINRKGETFSNDFAVSTFVDVLRLIHNHVGEEKFRALMNFRVNRGMLLAEKKSRYHRTPLLGYHVLTYNATVEKANILRDVARKFNLPDDFIQVKIVDS